METTITIFKQNGLVAVMLAAVTLTMNGQFQRLDERIQGLDGEVQELRIEMTEGFKAVRFEMAVVDRSIRAEMAEMDQSIRVQMTEMDQSIRAEMAKMDQSIRAEMTGVDNSIRAEMAAGFQAVRSDISDLRERMARVETKVDGIEERLDSDSSSASR